MKTSFKILIFLAAAASITFFPARIQSEGIKIFESTKSEEETKETIEKILGDINEKRFKKKEETLGFSYLYKNTLISPFTYSIYIGPIKSESPRTMVRIEGTRGDASMLEHIFSEEGLKKDYYKPEKLRVLKQKSHIFSQGLNLYAPWAAVLYNGFRSPRLTGKQMFRRFLFYLILDAVAIYAGGTNWFQDDFKINAYRGNIAAGLFLIRAMGAAQSANTIRGHNRIVELKYSFPYK